MSDERTSRTLSLTTGGITLLGVLLSIGVTVGMGLDAPWWVRVLVGLATTLVLSVIVKLGRLISMFIRTLSVLPMLLERGELVRLTQHARC